MEKLNADQVLTWVLIIIALGAVAWAALQNWFFHPQSQYNQVPAYFPPFGSYPPHAGGDYTQTPTPRRSSPAMLLLLVGIAGFGLFKWVSGIKPLTDKVQKTDLAFEAPADLKRVKDKAGVFASGDRDAKSAMAGENETTGKIQPIAN
ncbi:MAG: hypothetical protein HUU01_20875, partial [Saprospiraceae bacterium]|nr:hypothetical protein [Saprospiraceae bacterium]